MAQLRLSRLNGKMLEDIGKILDGKSHHEGVIQPPSFCSVLLPAQRIDENMRHDIMIDDWVYDGVLWNLCGWAWKMVIRSSQCM